MMPCAVECPTCSGICAGHHGPGDEHAHQAVFTKLRYGGYWRVTVIHRWIEDEEDTAKRLAP